MEIKNPWPELPPSSPFVLANDAELLSVCGSKASGLRTEVLPDPYVGDPNSASVILLALNPGFRQADIDLNMASEEYVDQSRRNLTHESRTPFLFFDPAFEYTGGNIWWSRILAPLMKAGIPKQEIAKKIACVQYLPYHSVTYRDLGVILPSQRYSFFLVREAIRTGKTIVVMRSSRFWLKSVPELNGYPYLTVRNYRNPSLSPTNLGEQAFDTLIEALSTNSDLSCI